MELKQYVVTFYVHHDHQNAFHEDLFDDETKMFHTMINVGIKLSFEPWKQEMII